MFQDVLLFELFQRTFFIFLFFIKIPLNFPDKTYRSVKKRFAIAQRNTLLSGLLSNKSASLRPRPKYRNNMGL